MTTDPSAFNLATTSRRIDIGAIDDDGNCPMLTIAIPTFQRFDLLPQTLSSVFRLRFNICVEVIVVDNDPDNDELAVQAMIPFSGKSFKYFKNCSNVGMFANWNRCIELARGEYVTILHDDDLLEPAFAEEINRWFAQTAKPGPCMAWRYGVLDERAQRPGDSEFSTLHRLQTLIAPMRRDLKHKSVAHLFFGNPFAGTVGVVLDRGKAQAIGGFNPTWYPIADYEFWCRWASAYGAIPIAKRQVSLYRKRQNESMFPETRLNFVIKSRALRELLITKQLVPTYFGWLLNRLQQQQLATIKEDWRISGQASLSFSASVVIVFWRVLFALLAWFGSLSLSRSRAYDEGKPK